MNKFYKTLIKEKVSIGEFCDKIGILPDSLRRLTVDKTPKWIKAFNFGYKLASKVKDIEVKEPEIIIACKICKQQIHETMGVICSNNKCPRFIPKPKKA